MTSTYDMRITEERRLLAALFLYPRHVDLDAHSFLSPQHGVLFDCIQQAYSEFPWKPTNGTTYDDIALAIVLELVRARAAQIVRFLGKSFRSRPAELVRIVEGYVIHVLMARTIREDEIDHLIAAVRHCPRCGK